ncbi:MAG: ribonuclease P protein subunit [Candidatus Caldarchaeum sp.]|uniref:Ribonuclease P protein component 1 n=1 Tax=Caldiarchaeum subterraneum TaxID=311458 RepID=A0A7C5L6I3_CALS0
MSGKHPASIFILGLTAKIEYNGRLFTGTIVRETRNTLTLKTGGSEKTIPKNGSVLRLVLEDGYEVKIEGSSLVGRPFERLLKVR